MKKPMISTFSLLLLAASVPYPRDGHAMGRGRPSDAAPCVASRESPDSIFGTYCGRTVDEESKPCRLTLERVANGDTGRELIRASTNFSEKSYFLQSAVADDSILNGGDVDTVWRRYEMLDVFLGPGKTSPITKFVFDSTGEITQCVF